MLGNKQPEVIEFVEALMPESTHEEKVEATQNVREYLAFVFDIYKRLEREGKLEEVLERIRQQDASDHPETNWLEPR